MAHSIIRVPSSDGRPAAVFGLARTGLAAARALLAGGCEGWAWDDRADRPADGTALHVQFAVGYGGRQEIIDAVRGLLQEHLDAGEDLDQVIDGLRPELLAPHLYTTGTPDPDLIIRTSGEIRLSGFLLWQSAHSEFHFTDAYWPAFRKIDFLRALRDFAGRKRRFGR